MTKMAALLESCTLEEQRAVIRFFNAEGLSGAEIHSRMSKVYGSKCMNSRNVYKWMERFNTGHETVVDRKRSGRPVTASTPSTVSRVESLVMSDRRLTVEDIATQLSISIGTAHKILKQDLLLTKVSCRWVPRMLTDVHKSNRFEISQELLQRYQDEGDEFLSKIVTGDETWVYLFEPESKRQSLEWKHAKSPTRKKFKASRSVKKVMLTIFWDMKGPILTSFQSDSVNSSTYCDVLDQLRTKIRFKRRGMLSKGVILQHDNATPHTARITKEKITSFNWETLRHPPYSPDLAPSDYHLFGPMKDALRGRHFPTAEDAEECVQKWLRTTPETFYSSGIRKLVKRWNKCIEMQGDYVEK